MSKKRKAAQFKKKLQMGRKDKPIRRSSSSTSTGGYVTTKKLA